MRHNEILNEFYNPENDKLAFRDYDDTRRPKLTLGKINKLRKYKDTQRVDKKTHLSFIPQMYGNSSDDGM